MGESRTIGDFLNSPPQCGYFIKLDITINAIGHEQQGYRYALVVSRNSLNKSGKGLAIICPITNTDTGDAFHLSIPDGCGLTGFLLVDQVRSIDYVGRQASYAGKCPEPLFMDVLRCLRVLTFPKDFKI